MKRIFTLFLCVLLALSMCAYGEQVAGDYKLSDSTLAYLLSEVNEREPKAMPLVEAIARDILLKFGADGRIQGSFELRNINQIMPAIEKTVMGEETGASLFWSEDDGKLLLVAHAKNANASTDLGASLVGDTLTVSYGIRFQRVTGENGFAGVWEMDMDLIGQIFAQKGAAIAAQHLLSTAHFYLSLNEDGTMGVTFTADIGSYHDGIVEFTEYFSQQVEGADGATVVYVLDGDTLVLSSTTVVDGIIQSISEKFYRVQQTSD